MKKKKGKGWIWFIVVVVVLLATALLLPKILRPGNLNLNAQQFEVAKVTKGDMQVTVHGTGSIEAMDTATVNAGASGLVDAVLVEEGDAVKAGQVIATLNADALNTQINSLKEQIITQDAAIAKLRAMPAVKTLTAPVDSRVKAIYAKTNQDVSVSMSAKGALMLLSTDGKMKVDFVPKAGTAVKAGSAVKLTIDGKTVSSFIATVPDGTTDEAEAIILDDSYAVGLKAVVKDAKGAELGQGVLEVNRPLLVTAYSGRVDRLYVAVGDKVSSGHKLLRLTGTILDPNFESQLVQRQKLQDDLDQAYADLKDLTIAAPADGIVTNLTLQANSMAQEGMAVCTIQQNTGFKLVVAVDELDIAKIRLGQKADVKIDALPDAEASGEVIKIASIGVKSGDVTTFDVTLKVDAPAGTLAKMSASTDIEVAFKADSLLVPVEAIHTANGKSFVFGTLPYDVSAESTAQPTGVGQGNPGFPRMLGNRAAANQAGLERSTIEVTVGLVSDSTAEILSGLKEGDEIAVPVAQNNTNPMLGFGGGRQSDNSGKD